MTQGTIITITLFLVYVLLAGYFLYNYDVIIKKFRFLLRPKESDMSSMSSIDYSMFEFNEALRALPQAADYVTSPESLSITTDWKIGTLLNDQTYIVRQYRGETEFMEIPKPDAEKMNCILNPSLKFDQIDLSDL